MDSRPALHPLTILGREPAAWVGLIEAVLALLILFPLAAQLGMTAEWAILVMAFVSALAGAFTAWATRDTALGAITGLVKATISLAAFYKLELTLDQQASLTGLVAVAMGFWQRTQTSPMGYPVDPSPSQVVPVDDPPWSPPSRRPGAPGVRGRSG